MWDPLQRWKHLKVHPNLLKPIVESLKTTLDKMYMIYKMLEGPMNDPGPPPVDQMVSSKWENPFLRDKEVKTCQKWLQP